MKTLEEILKMSEAERHQFSESLKPEILDYTVKKLPYSPGSQITNIHTNRTFPLFDGSPLLLEYGGNVVFDSVVAYIAQK